MCGTHIVSPMASKSLLNLALESFCNTLDLRSIGMPLQQGPRQFSEMRMLKCPNLDGAKQKAAFPYPLWLNINIRHRPSLTHHQ